MILTNYTELTPVRRKRDVGVTEFRRKEINYVITTVTKLQTTEQNCE